MQWLLFIFLGLNGFAQDEVETFVHIPDLKQTPYSVPELDGAHSKCMEVNGQVIGDNIHQPVRLASVSKLVTTYWALKTLGPDHRFRVQLGYNTKQRSLYIDTKGDPFFGQRRLFFLLSELNQQGITEIDRVEFLRSSIFLVPVENRDWRYIEIGAGNGPLQKSMKADVNRILNTASWSSSLKSAYQSFYDEMSQRGHSLVRDVKFKTGEVRWIHQPQPVTWSSYSPPLVEYLKQLNKYSMNYIGDRLFHTMGGRDKLEEFLARDKGLSIDPFEMFTGSGLNIGQTYNRVDNMASCHFMLQLNKKLRQLLIDNGLNLSDVFLVVGKEVGTLNPGGQSPWAGRLMAKTGTLKNAVTLSGFIRTNSGEVPFGLFFQTGDKPAARRERNRQLDRWFANLGLGSPITYSEKGFIPVDPDFTRLQTRSY